MRKLFPLLSVTVLFSGLTLVWAAEEKTISGEGQCAKCALNETKSCQNAIVTEEDGKKVTYYLVHNATSKKFHKNICQETKKIKATGEVKEEKGKMTLTPSKIEVVE
jgi:RecG-like helicase